MPAHGMKMRLSTWHAILLGPTVLALQYLTIAGIPPANRAVAIGIIFYLVIPVIILLVVDGIKIYQRYSKKGSKE